MLQTTSYENVYRVPNNLYDEYIYSEDPSLRLVRFTCLAHRPNLAAFLALRQCYSMSPVYLRCHDFYEQTEEELGEKVIRLCVKNGHYGVIEEGGDLMLNVVGFPHSVINQHRTHRIGVTFDVASFRYTGNEMMQELACKSIIKETYETNSEFCHRNSFFIDEDFLTKYFYLRPLGNYTDREGDLYAYDSVLRSIQIEALKTAVLTYYRLRTLGVSEEHARDVIPYSIRQPYTVSFHNQRSLLHFLEMRSTKDAQLEIRVLAELVAAMYRDYNPGVSEWHTKKRLYKNNLAP
jgi:thymidylate synthase (FAD)